MTFRFSSLACMLVGMCACSSLLALSDPSTENKINKEETMTNSVPAQDPTFRMKTNYGDIYIRLYAAKAPQTVENFRKYVAEKFYNGTTFHRVIDGFVIQGGGFTSNMAQKEIHAPIMSEASRDVPNKRGSIAMARTNYPHSATSQFFINVQDNPNLNRTKTTGEPDGYAVFGEVIKGMDVVDAIRKVPTTTKADHQNVPVTPVVIEDVEEVKEGVSQA